MNIITKGLGGNFIITLGYGFVGVGDYFRNTNNYSSVDNYLPL